METQSGGIIFFLGNLKGNLCFFGQDSKTNMVCRPNAPVFFRQEQDDVETQFYGNHIHTYKHPHTHTHTHTDTNTLQMHTHTHPYIHTHLQTYTLRTAEGGGKTTTSDVGSL